jgi:hypothetical protein
LSLTGYGPVTRKRAVDAGQLPPQVTENVAAYRAVGGQRFGEAGKQLVEDLAAARMQVVQVPRSRPAMLWSP